MSIFLGLGLIDGMRGGYSKTGSLEESGLDPPSCLPEKWGVNYRTCNIPVLVAPEGLGP